MSLIEGKQIEEKVDLDEGILKIKVSFKQRREAR
jgi:hypothetical protein